MNHKRLIINILIAFTIGSCSMLLPTAAPPQATQAKTDASGCADIGGITRKLERGHRTRQSGSGNHRQDQYDLFIKI